MSTRDKYQSLIDLANTSGITNLEVREDGDVLHISGTAPSDEAKQKLWDEYNRIDPDMRSGDLVLNIGGGGEGEQTYTVKSGDTLSKIGKQFGVSWQDIHEANKDEIKDPDKIFPGQTFRIPRKK
ncbi:MAG TPA: LysM peptidoglycan-binding domain-containing protein [Pyrinomonadaceae bacterium]|nr:LysM peptidoglycan-binding domain-containing protein [Pyrinomonadaceae bacterium]